MLITNHRLDGVRFLDGWPHAGGVFKPPAPEFLLLHFTDLDGMDSAVEVLAERRLSCHLIVGRDGGIVQMLPFDRVAWHAGDSSYRGKTGLNHYALGIEMDNCGRLGVNADGVLQASCGKQIPVQDAVFAIHEQEHFETAWHRFPEPQVAAVTEVCTLLAGQYGIHDIVGHDQVAPGRKRDPGPAFPMAQVRRQILGTEQPAPAAGRMAHPVIPLQEPSADASPLCLLPLQTGTDCDILDRKPGWIRAGVMVTGWIGERDVVQMTDEMFMTAIGEIQVRATPDTAGQLVFRSLPGGVVVRRLQRQGGGMRVAFRLAGWLPEHAVVKSAG